MAKLAASGRVVIAADTPDLARAAAFYRDLLGMPVLQDRSPEFVLVELGPGAALCLDAAPGGAPAARGMRFILPVGDLGAAERGLLDRGVPVHGRSGKAPPRWFSVLDPDGREVIFEPAG